MSTAKELFSAAVVDNHFQPRAPLAGCWCWPVSRTQYRLSGKLSWNERMSIIFFWNSISSVFIAWCLTRDRTSLYQRVVDLLFVSKYLHARLGRSIFRNLFSFFLHVGTLPLESMESLHWELQHSEKTLESLQQQFMLNDDYELFEVLQFSELREVIPFFWRVV